MTKQLEALIASEIADFFAGVAEIHTNPGGPNTVEEAQQQLTERVIRIASECESALIAALEQAQALATQQGNIACALFDEVTSLRRNANTSPLAMKLPDVKHGEVLATVAGLTGCGKSAVAGEIEIALRAIGLPVIWQNGDAEKRMTGADWLTALEMYKPSVRIVEHNIPRAAGGQVEGE